MAAKDHHLNKQKNYKNEKRHFNVVLPIFIDKLRDFYGYFKPFVDIFSYFEL